MRQRIKILCISLFLFFLNPIVAPAEKSTDGHSVIYEALHYADWVAEQLGIELPPVHLVSGNDAYAQNNQIFIGVDLAKELSPIGIAQIIFHEVGHVDMGHVGIMGDLATTLYQNDLISDLQWSALMQNDELTADIYAGIASWILEPAEVPEISNWLINQEHQGDETHPSSLQRAEVIAFIMDALDIASESGLLDSYSSSGSLENWEQNFLESNFVQISQSPINGGSFGETSEASMTNPGETEIGSDPDIGGDGGG